MDTRQYSNRYWKYKNQKIGSRHIFALKYIDNGNVLDVGCGDGLLISLINKRKIKAIGIDFSERAIENAKKKGLYVKLGDATNIPYKDNSFSIVVATDVLEHIFNPEVAIKEMIRVSNNKVIFVVPNFNSFSARIQTLFGRIPQQNKKNKGHIYWFNKNEIINILNNNHNNISKYNIVPIPYLNRNKYLSFIGEVFAFILPKIFSVELITIIDVKK